MCARDNEKAAAAKLHRSNTVSLYGILMTGVLELGEIARMEIEIHKLYSPGYPQPRCPNWHGSSSSHGPAPRP